MTRDQFMAFQNRAVEDLRIPDNPEEIIKKNMQLPGIKQVYIQALTTQSARVESLELSREEKVLEISESLKKGPLLYSAKELKEKASSNEEIQKLDRQLIEEKFYLNWLDSTATNINSVAFSIKNWIEWKKITTTNF